MSCAGRENRRQVTKRCAPSASCPDSATSTCRTSSSCIPPPSFDPPTAVNHNKILATHRFCVLHVRVGRIELPSYPWQGYVLPLNYTRKRKMLHKSLLLYDSRVPRIYLVYTRKILFPFYCARQDSNPQ